MSETKPITDKVHALFGGSSRMSCEVCMRSGLDADIRRFMITVPFSKKTEQYVFARAVQTCGSKSCLEVAERIVAIREADMT